MKKKPAKILLIAICALVVLWGVMFTTDYIRCSSLQEPLFVIPIGEIAKDGGSGTYLGPGYTVDIKKNIDAEYGISVSAVEMKVLGKVIAASIT